MSLEDAKRLADYYTTHHDPKMKWMWGEGLFGYSLGELNDYLNENRYSAFLKKYGEYWSNVNPEITSSDTCAPGLITNYLYKKLKEDKYKELTLKVIDYMKNEPRNKEGLVNHMGHNDVSKWYPKSIWVDSLMMFGVFSSLYGKENNDKDLLNMAKSQTILFDQYLSDEKDHLYYHSYYLDKGYHYPKSKIYWGRGNAWVISALPKILDNLDECKEKEDIKKILKKASDAIIKCQNKDGSFSTILKGIKCYKETSATCLVADGLMHAVRKGYLDDSYLSSALKAYEYATSKISYVNNKVLLRGISNPTIPLPVLPFTGYAIIGKMANWSYGMAAYIFASIEYDMYINKINIKIA